MSLEKMLIEFDGDRDFVSDLLFTIRQEINKFHARLEQVIEQAASDKMTAGEARRIAHIIKSTAMTLHLHEHADQASAIEREIQMATSENPMAMDKIQRLATVVDEMRSIVGFYFEKLEQL
ncbi:Hpt domain-containing protein [Aliidiomarina sanyensis]|uniref:HPt domain-containing protein n=1 Tax=Aliidiomarina sanyensis TaxID=1249555 RepID=A0A432W593_9GAMM|nr:Hpt domain-containing protein [Aliidiomarina sanyensis]RUO24940.1 hypothetical protein CWE11_11900 [Aliidiomarina sanyensis]